MYCAGTKHSFHRNRVAVQIASRNLIELNYDVWGEISQRGGVGGRTGRGEEEESHRTRQVGHEQERYDRTSRIHRILQEPHGAAR